MSSETVFTIITSLCLMASLRHIGADVTTLPTNTTQTSFIGTASQIPFGNQSFLVAMFLGIPYAETPKRFEKPVLKNPPNGTFRAVRFGNMCPQVNDSSNCFQGQTMSEDCLFLNIYVPLSSSTQQQNTVPTSSTSSPVSTSTQQTTTSSSQTTSASGSLNFTLPVSNTSLAVLVFVHGGAFVSGSSNCYDGTALAGLGNIIVVTINYRLGALGFLTTNDDLLPGNLALWDQMTAIRWVKKNIAAFGGDPDRITIDGHSAGSYSVLYQALYAGNDNLFQRVIAQSGTPVAAKSTSRVGYSTTMEVARQLRCNLSSKEIVKNCLMNKTALELVSVQPPMLVPGQITIEPTLDDPLVTFDPAAVLSQTARWQSPSLPAVPQNFLNKDLLIGIAADDGDVVYSIYAFILAGGNMTKLNETMIRPVDTAGLRALLTMFLQQSYTDSVEGSILDAILDRYTNWESPSSQAVGASVLSLLTDVTFTIPSLDTASSHIQWRDVLGISSTVQTTPPTSSGGPVQGSTFVYRFTLPPSPTGLPWFHGTGHSAEIPFLFGPSWPQNDSNFLRLSQTIITYWSNFVKTGDPNKGEPRDVPIVTLPYWKEYNNSDQNFLELSSNSFSSSKLKGNIRHFMSELIPSLKSRLADVYNEGVQAGKTCPGSSKNLQTRLSLDVVLGVLVTCCWLLVARPLWGSL